MTSTKPLTGVVSNAGSALRWLAAEPPNVDETHHYLEPIVLGLQAARATLSSDGVRGLARQTPPAVTGGRE